MKIGHIALSVSNLDKSIVFYRDNFGLECAEKFRIEAVGLEICLLRKNNVTLELFRFKDFKALPQYRKNVDSDLQTLGVKHFSFEVDNIQEAYSELKKSGVELATDILIFEDGRKYFFLKDPDGILIEIMEE